MSKVTVKTKCRCPGDMYDISISVCKGRQRVHYPKCPVCHYRTEIVAVSSGPEEENGVEPSNTGNNKPRKVVELYSTRDKLINRKIFKSYDIRGI